MVLTQSALMQKNIIRVSFIPLLTISKIDAAGDLQGISTDIVEKTF